MGSLLSFICVLKGIPGSVVLCIIGGLNVSFCYLRPRNSWIEMFPYLFQTTNSRNSVVPNIPGMLYWSLEIEGMLVALDCNC